MQRTRDLAPVVLNMRPDPPSIIISCGRAIQAGPQQLDSGVGAGFWLYEVCMYVYGKS